MGKNFAQKMDTAINEAMNIAERSTRQFDVDTFQIALSRYPKLSLGYQRIMEITELWCQVRREYSNCIDMGPETDVARHHMDAELEEIIKGKETMIPWAKRYPELKACTYEGRRKR